ncbi:hypothetical protein [Nannocystis punicea]|uniref:Uncharacterized protein n=1 Tax=Nannocystis punicea TaxID=2995304 RepID=A0ABY7HCJ1_9BACT|nr:hypothetical protein [Nannocystis poenicansa]WAS96828.1 hypothetical protein O0S08_11830 [Nannocystis poenicansa]
MTDAASRGGDAFDGVPPHAYDRRPSRFVIPALGGFCGECNGDADCLGVCGECSSDGDCGPGEICSGPKVDLDLGALTGAKRL